MLIPANNTNTYKTGISVTVSAFLKMQFDTKIVLEENPVSMWQIPFDNYRILSETFPVFPQTFKIERFAVIIEGFSCLEESWIRVWLTELIKGMGKKELLDKVIIYTLYSFYIFSILYKSVLNHIFVCFLILLLGQALRIFSI